MNRYLYITCVGLLLYLLGGKAVGQSLATTVQVGTGQTYTTLTGNGGLFDAINTNGLSGNTTVIISSNLYENGTNGLSSSGMNGYSLRIIPDTASERHIVNSTNLSVAMLRFTGVSKVTFDGRYNGSGSYIRIIQTNSSPSNCKPAMIYSGDLDSDSLINTIIETNNQSASTPGTIFIGSGHNHVTLVGCTIRDAQGSPGTAGVPDIAIYSNSSYNQLNIGNSSMGNTVVNFNLGGIYLDSSGSGSVIVNNQLYNTSNRNNITGIYIGSGDSHQVQMNSIFMQSGQVNGYLNGIYIKGGGVGHSISNNSIGGSSTSHTGNAMVNNSTSATIGIRLEAGTTSYSNIDGNEISNIANSNSTTGGSLYGIYIEAGNVNIGTNAGNVIGGNGTSDTVIVTGNSAGIAYFGTDTVNILNNSINKIKYKKGGTDRISGIEIGTGAFTVTKLNNIQNIEGNMVATFPNFSTGIYGIFCDNALDNESYIGENFINNIKNSSTSSTSTGAYGMGIEGSSGKLTLTKNRILNIIALGTGTGSSASGVAGIMTGQGKFSMTNNQITLISNNSNDTKIYGILDASSTDSIWINYNTILIGGTTGSGTNNNTYCYFRGSSSKTSLRNNILYNGRYTAGSGKMLAFGYNNSSNFSQSSINYSLFVVPDSSYLYEATSSVYKSFSDLSTIYTIKRNSNWVASPSEIPMNNLFSNPNIGNLNIKTSSSECWAVNGRGLPLLNYTQDYDGGSHTRSESINEGATDIGSDEFTPATNPPSLTNSGSHNPGDTEYFYYAGQLVAKIRWHNTGSLPTFTGYKYWPGAWPNDTTNNGSTSTCKIMNSYWVFGASGGSGYKYDLTLYYDSALFGTVTSATKLRATKKQSSVAGSWHVQASLVDSIENSLTLYNQTGFSEFTGTDEDAPLPEGDPIGNNLIMLNQAICSGDTADDLTGSTPYGGVGMYSYQYIYSTTDSMNGFSNAPGTSTNIDYSPGILTQTTWYRRIVTSGGSTDTSNAVQITILSTVTPSVSLSINTNPSCQGNSVTLTATPTNGGGSPNYKFYINGSLVQNGSSSTYTTSSFNNGDTVYVVLTANNLCQTTATDTSSEIYISVTTPVTPSVTISASQTPPCWNTSITYTATPVNGGGSPTYTFKANGTTVQSGSSATYTSSHTIGTVITCIMSTSLTCVTQNTDTSNSITVTYCNLSSTWSNINVWTPATSESNDTTDIIINTNPVTVSTTVHCRDLTIQNGDTLIVLNGGHIIINGDLTINGAFIMNAGIITFTKSGTTIPAGTYHQLRVCAAGTVYAGGNTTVNHDLYICSGTTFSDNSYTINLKKNVYNYGTHTGSGKLYFNGTGVQSMTDSNTTTSPYSVYANVELNNSNGLRAGTSGSSNNKIRITGNLTLTSGNFNLNANTLQIGTSGSASGNIVSSGTGYITSAYGSSQLNILGNSSALVCNLRLQWQGNITINRDSGARFLSSSYIYRSITLTTGNLNMNGYNITLGSTSGSGLSFAGSGSITNNYTSTGTLTIQGGASNPTISSLNLDTMVNVIIKLSNGISLGDDCYLKGLWYFSNGRANLNGNVVTLSSTASISETQGRLFYGTSGYLTTTRYYGTALSSVNPGGLGIEITTDNPPGSLGIIRGHTLSGNGGGGSSIKRKYTMVPQNYVNSSFKFFFDTSELAGSTVSQLRFNYSYDNSSWFTYSGGNGNYYVTSGSISCPDTGIYITVSDSVVSPLSPVFTQVNNIIKKQSENYIIPNPFTDVLRISLPENTYVYITDISGRLITLVKGNGNWVEIDTRRWAAGIYISRIGNQSVKILKY